VSAECDNCYADSGSKRLAAQHHLKLWDEGSSRYFTKDDYWKQPAKWNRLAVKEGIRLKVFCASYSDVAEDRRELDSRRWRLREAILATPMLDWMLLTKRPENVNRLLPSLPDNVWMGTTIGVRSSLSRLDHLRKIQARIHFISAEPLLEDLLDVDLHGVDLAIIGGESGPKARRFGIEWGRRLEACARRAKASVFWKQMGAHAYDCFGREIELKDDHGGEPSEWPAGEWPREFPVVSSVSAES
jgi:protein gp37